MFVTRRPSSGLAERAVGEWGRIDFLLANAGIADQSSVATGDPAQWRNVVETNLLGVLYSCRAVLPTMLEQASGHILIMSSVSGRESYVGEPVYIATKWAQVGFAHALRLELLETGVRVTVIEPGLVDTPLTRDNLRIRPLLEEIEPLAAEDVARAVDLCLSTAGARGGDRGGNPPAGPTPTPSRLSDVPTPAMISAPCPCSTTQLAFVRGAMDNAASTNLPR